MHYILQLLFPNHLQWQNIYLASPLCWFYVFIHLDHTTTLQNTLKTYFPIREGLRWYNWRNTKQGSSGYLNDSDGVTNMGGSLGPPSEGSPTVGADLDDLFVSWGPIAWGIILERDVGRCLILEKEMKNRDIMTNEKFNSKKTLHKIFIFRTSYNSQASGSFVDKGHT